MELLLSRVKRKLKKYQIGLGPSVLGTQYAKFILSVSMTTQQFHNINPENMVLGSDGAKVYKTWCTLKLFTKCFIFCAYDDLKALYNMNTVFSITDMDYNSIILHLIFKSIHAITNSIYNKHDIVYNLPSNFINLLNNSAIIFEHVSDKKKIKFIKNTAIYEVDGTEWDVTETFKDNCDILAIMYGFYTFPYTSKKIEEGDVLVVGDKDILIKCF